MKKRIFANTRKKIPLSTVCILATLTIAIVFVLLGALNSSQSVSAELPKLRFVGDYSTKNIDWTPIEEGKHIPTSDGEVTLRGQFKLFEPDTDKVLRILGADMPVSLYFNHLSASVYCDSGTMVFSCELNELGPDACGIMRSYFTLSNVGITEETENSVIYIALYNPHFYGNENAIDDFLDNMTLAEGFDVEKDLADRGSMERTIGLVIAISSLIIIGIAAFSTVIHIRFAKEMWLIGLMSLFAGGYFIFDAAEVGLWNPNNVINTRALGLCMMLYMLFASALIVTLLRGKEKRLAFAATLTSGAAIFSCISASFFPYVKFFDTWLFWTLFELVAVGLLIFCQARSIKGAPIVQKLLLCVGITALSAFPIDALATTLGWWGGGMISKHVFLLIFVMALVVVLRIIPNHINAAIKARQLEAEQQALKLELQESRISIMLSQMQPHFIFNTLNTIYHLCEINPDTARKTISSFSEYLRNNIDNLGHSDMISFEKELSFVKTYLDIEKVRFDDELELSFDIRATNFKLPVLTVQPIVENAVKHGTSKKEGVASLSVSTEEYDDRYEIVIADTGVGFDTMGYANDGHKHIGISSVTERLKNLCGGTLTIDSTPGVGTVATIRIPKKESEQ